MNNEHPIKALLVVTLTALVCSILVTVAAVTLKPIQKAYQNLERNRAIVAVSGLADKYAELSDREIVSLFQSLDARIIDLETGKFDNHFNPDTFDSWQTNNDSKLMTAIPTEQDSAKLGHRPRLMTVYFVNQADQLQRMILPIYGQGMWSTIYGYIAIEADLTTIADIIFYQQKETAGIGDKILHPSWQASWQGRKIYDKQLNLQIAGGQIKTSESSEHHIDAISGATVTVDSVKNMVRYWFGNHGYAKFLRALDAEVNS